MESLFNKDAGLNTWNFIKKTPIKAFSCEDREIFRRSLLLTPSAFLWRSLLLLTGFLRMDKLTRVQLLHKLRETHLHISMTQSDFFYKFHFGKCSYELTRLVPLLCSLGKSACYSNEPHDFSVTTPKCYDNVCVNSFFTQGARNWNSLPVESFSLTYDLLIVQN